MLGVGVHYVERLESVEAIGRAGTALQVWRPGSLRRSLIRGQGISMPRFPRAGGRAVCSVPRHIARDGRWAVGAVMYVKGAECMKAVFILRLCLQQRWMTGLRV
jgi:hypothetical protein